MDVVFIRHLEAEGQGDGSTKGRTPDTPRTSLDLALAEALSEVEDNVPHTGHEVEHKRPGSEELDADLDGSGPGGESSSDAGGLEVHAGHGLDFRTAETIAGLSEVVELNIGHFLIGEALFGGLAEAVKTMRAAMDRGRARIVAASAAS